MTSPHPVHPAGLAHTLSFIRHGATEPNLSGLRCGGDLDAPLTDVGRSQAAETGRRLRAQAGAFGVIVSSDLQRTRDTARIVAQELGGVELVIVPGFAERHLGAWNLCPIAATEADLARGVTPPGGESNETFIARIAGAIEALLPHLHRRPLLVASKGVARALGELLGQPGRLGLANGELAHFDLAALVRRGDRRAPA